MIELYIIAASVIGATIGFWSAALVAARRQRSQYNRGWTAGKDFATRQFHDTLQDSITTRRRS